jgi:hypothetical protein
MIRQIAPNIRISYQGDPRIVAYDVCVEKLDSDEWTMVRGFNSMSDDYACINANEFAYAMIERDRLTVKLH